MKYRKIISKYLSHKSNNNTQVALALVAGLAAGAVISILFAPDSGAGTRGKIASSAKNLRYGFQDKYNLLKEKVFGVEAIESDIVKQEIPRIKSKATKNAKSDPKEDALNRQEQQDQG